MRLRTKELSTRTWPDFERLFSQGNGWDSCACLTYQAEARETSRERGKKPVSVAERRAINHPFKRQLVEAGRAHGILVYADAEPVGWCQFGPGSELRVGNTGSSESVDEAPWKITCFVTLKDYQRQGVAAEALQGALAAMRRKGAERVRAYPYHLLEEEPPPDLSWREKKADLGRGAAGVAPSVVRREGPITYYSGKAFLRHDVMVNDIGPVNAVYWRGASMFHAGTVAMFERAGFQAIRVLPTPPRVKSPWLLASRVVMEKSL